MKKTIQKMLCAAAALTLSFSLFGCSNSEVVDDPQTVLENASQKMQELDSVSLKADIEISKLSGDDPSEMLFNMPLSMTMERVGRKSDLTYHISMEMEFQGMNIKVEHTYFDEMLYSETESKKTAATISYAEAVATAKMGNISADFKNMKATKENDKIVITIQPTEDELREALKILGNMEEGLLDVDTLEATASLKFDVFKVVINDDGYIESEELSFTAKAEGTKVVLSVKLEMSGFNSTTVEKVNPDEYENVDDMYE